VSVTSPSEALVSLFLGPAAWETGTGASHPKLYICCMYLNKLLIILGDAALYHIDSRARCFAPHHHCTVKPRECAHGHGQGHPEQESSGSFI